MKTNLSKLLKPLGTLIITALAQAAVDKGAEALAKRKDRKARP